MKKSPCQYDDALAYLAYLPFVAPLDTLLSLLRSHGRALALHRSVVFTALLLKLCTADYASLLPHTHPAAKTSAHPNNHHHATTTGNNTSNSHNKHSKKVTATDVTKSFTHLLSDAVVVPSDRLPIADVLYLFSNDNASLLTLLQGFVDASPGRHLPPKVATTLMELYLNKYSTVYSELHSLTDTTASNNATTSTANTSNANLTKQVEIERLEHTLHSTDTLIMSLLDGAHTSYDPAHALLLCHTFHYERGQRYLLEKQSSTDLLMRILIQNNDVKEVFKVLRREGNKNPEMYVQVLTYFVQQSIVPEGGSVSGKTGVSSRYRRSGSGSDSDRGSDSEVETESEDSDDDEERYAACCVLLCVCTVHEQNVHTRVRLYIKCHSALQVPPPHSCGTSHGLFRWNSIMDVMDLIEKEAVLSPLQVRAVFCYSIDVDVLMCWCADVLMCWCSLFAPCHMQRTHVCILEVQCLHFCLAQVISILALNPKLPLHVACNYMANTLKVLCQFLLRAAALYLLTLFSAIRLTIPQNLTESTEGVKSSVQSAITDIEAVAHSKITENKVRMCSSCVFCSCKCVSFALSAWGMEMKIAITHLACVKRLSSTLVFSYLSSLPLTDHTERAAATGAHAAAAGPASSGLRAPHRVGRQPGADRREQQQLSVRRGPRGRG